MSMLHQQDVHTIRRGNPAKQDRRLVRKLGTPPHAYVIAGRPVAARQTTQQYQGNKWAKKVQQRLRHPLALSMELTSCIPMVYRGVLAPRNHEATLMNILM
eukprot:5733241-Amphidinium_carterae.2